MNVYIKRAFICFLILFLSHSVHALDTRNIIAYPVPFNPLKGSVRYITFGNEPGKTALNIDKFQLEIYDINGDLVIRRTYNSSSAVWNGRNERGKLVKPGLYIVKVTVENSSNGDFGRKFIRVLIRY